MSKFKIPSKKITVEGQDLTVQQMTAGIREQFSRIRESKLPEDEYRVPYFIAANCCIEPKLSEEEWKEEGLSFVDAVLAAAMELSETELSRSIRQKKADPSGANEGKDSVVPEGSSE